MVIPMYIFPQLLILGRCYFGVLNLLTFHMSVITYSCVLIPWVVLSVEMSGLV